MASTYQAPTLEHIVELARGGELFGYDVYITIVASRFNSHITERLLESCVKTLQPIAKALDERIRETSELPWQSPSLTTRIRRVPGANEIPQALIKPDFFPVHSDTPYYDVAIALGCIIRGETPHFDIIANTSAMGLMQASLELKIPVINGILTTENEEQAQERASNGSTYAINAIEMLSPYFLTGQDADR